MEDSSLVVFQFLVSLVPTAPLLCTLSTANKTTPIVCSHPLSARISKTNNHVIRVLNLHEVEVIYFDNIRPMSTIFNSQDLPSFL